MSNNDYSSDELGPRFHKIRTLHVLKYLVVVAFDEHLFKTPKC